MYFLVKCSFQGCKRCGSVAQKKDDKYCNIHSKEKEEKEVKAENKKDEGTNLY